MNSLKDRVLIVIRGADQPLSSPQIARILGLPTQQVTSPVSKLCAYGVVDVIKGEGERRYRPKQEVAA